MHARCRCGSAVAELGSAALLSTAGVLFNFSQPNPSHRSTWLPAPSGAPNAGIVQFDHATEEMDLSDAATYLPFHSRLPSGSWFYPIASSCANTVADPCPLAPGYSVVSPGWSVSVWVSVRAFEGGAHLFSALQSGWTLRLSVHPTSRRLQLVDNNFAFGTPPVCTSNSAIPLVAWTLVGLTQTNTSAWATAAPTVLYVNGVTDASCANMPYFDSVAETKSNVHVGYDAMESNDVLHAQMALWAFFYYPLSAAQHALLAAEMPLAIAGPLLITLDPPPESGVPLLATTPRLYAVSMSSAPGLCGWSNLTLCLRSLPEGGANPACITWSSNAEIAPATFELTNPTVSNPIQFWWESSFNGTGLGGNRTAEEWGAMFVLPPNLTFARDVPAQQILDTAGSWAVDFSGPPPPPLGNTPTTVPWIYVPGALNNTGVVYLDCFFSRWIDVPLAISRGQIGVSTLPPAHLHPRGLGLSIGLFINFTSMQNGDFWQSVWKAGINSTQSDGSVRRFNVSIAVLQNFTIQFIYDTCTTIVPTQYLYGFTWHHLGITLSESGFVRITWNGALPRAWLPQQCGPALARYINPQLEWARFGPLATSGTQSNYDSNYWSWRAEIARLDFFNRSLLPEEMIVLAQSPPDSIATTAFPLRTFSIPPLTLAPGQRFTFSVFPPSYWGGNVALYMAANVSGVFSAGMRDASEDPGVEEARPWITGNVTSISFAPREFSSASAVRTIGIVFPNATNGFGECVAFETWIVGDTLHYANLVQSNWTICPTQVDYLLSKVASAFLMTQPSIHAVWQNLSNPAYPGVAAGAAAFRVGINDYLDFRVPADGATSGTPSMALIHPVHRDGTGITVIINVKMLRVQCNQMILHDDMFRMYLYCGGQLYVEHHGANSFSWSGCSVTTANNAGPSGILGGIPINLFTWVSLAFDPARNELHGYYWSPMGTAATSVRCYTSPEPQFRNTRMGGYSSSYSPVSVVAEALWFDYFVTYDEFKEITSKHVSTALLVGQHPIALTPPPQSCSETGPFTLTLTLPHYHGGIVNVSLSSDPPNLVSPAWIFWDPSASVKVGPQILSVSCGANGTRVFLELSDDSDLVHYTLEASAQGFRVASNLTDPMFHLNMTAAQPYFASPLDPASMSVALNGVDQFLDLNNASDTGLALNSVTNSILPDFFQSPNPSELIFPGWTASGWYVSDLHFPIALSISRDQNRREQHHVQCVGVGLIMKVQAVQCSFGRRQLVRS